MTEVIDNHAAFASKRSARMTFRTVSSTTVVRQCFVEAVSADTRIAPSCTMPRARAIVPKAGALCRHGSVAQGRVDAQVSRLDQSDPEI